MTVLFAQCVMCFRNAEMQNLAQSAALNAGILVIALPLLAGIGVIARLVWRRR